MISSCPGYAEVLPRMWTSATHETLALASVLRRDGYRHRAAMAIGLARQGGWASSTAT